MREGKQIVLHARNRSCFASSDPDTPPKWHVRGQENDILQSKLNTESASHGQFYDRISTVRIHVTLHERTFNYY